MLKQARLTFVKPTRCILSTQFRAVASLFSCFLLLSGVVLSDDDARRLNLPSSQYPTQTTPNNKLTSREKPTQDLATQLSQLEFRFQEARKIGSEHLDELMSQIVVLLEEARRLATQAENYADEELVEKAKSLVSQLETFQQFTESTSAFFNELAKLDAASLDEKATRSFFESISQRDASHLASFNEISNSLNTLAPTVATYRAELNRAAAALDALQTLEHWNSFVETRGSELERFYVAPDAAEKALAFITQTNSQPGLPKEFQILERRAAEWRFTSLNRVAIQRKILLALEAETTGKYWTFRATPDKIYYLQQPPRPGRNVCFANSQGARSLVDIPDQAPETATSESTQRLFLQSLADEARLIPESLRVDDAARWYAAWSAFLSRLQTTDALDPIVQFRLLHSITQTLSTGDFYFERRLAPTLRMLSVPRLSDAASLDIFQSENVEIQELRRLARSRIAFLPTDRLTVDKTTEELDAQTERFSFVYRRVGWLDRDFSGAWRCRRPENAPLPVGDLYVLLVTPNATTPYKPSVNAASLADSPTRDEASSPRFRWLKIGSSDGRQTTLKFAAPDVCVGTIVLCRSRVGVSPQITERGELERLLRR